MTHATPKPTPPTPQKAWASGLRGYIADFVAMRHFMWHLSQSRLRSRFRRSVLGVLWLILNPIIIAAIFVTIFGQVFGSGSMIEYAGYILIGHVLYDLFGQTLSGSAGTFLDAKNYLKQHRIPAIVFPLATSIYNLISTLIGFGSVLLIGLAFGVYDFSVALVSIPLIFLFYCFFILPLSVLSAIAGMKFGDFPQLVVYVTMIFYYLSPVFIPREVFDAPHLIILNTLSPLTNVMDAFRSALIDGSWPLLRHYLVLLGWGVVLSVLACVWLLREEKRIVFYN